MTKEEAIKILLRYDVNFYPHSASDEEQAIFMAIEALRCSETPNNSERAAETAQPDHTADVSKKVSISCTHENDLIFRQAAIEALARIFADCIEALEILPPAQPETHWIPCSEKLPEERGFYLTTTKDKAVYCDHWNEDNFDRTEMVIAWMPLPASYKGE